MKHIKNFGLAVLFVLVAYLPSLSAVFVEVDGWYAELNKPFWTPHHLVFAPVWTALYLMIGLAGFFGWSGGKREDRPAVLRLYLLQLLVNGLWSPLFFGLHQPFWSLGSLIFLWFLVLLCIGVFSLRSRLAAVLMVPYFLWISFAGALNVAIAVIN